MALVLFNMSIDAPDNTPPGAKEDLSINDQESLVELVLETFLGFENAIDEHEDDDQNESNKKTAKRIDLNTQNILALSQPQKLLGFNQLIFHPYKSILSNRFSFIETPPPELMPSSRIKTSV